MAIEELKKSFLDLIEKSPNPNGEFIATSTKKETALYRLKFDGRIVEGEEDETIEELDEPFYESE